MIEASLRRILDVLNPDDVVLDIGGWGRPFTRADRVMDLRPYESRGVLGHDGELPERFSRETWIQRDICDREPYPFQDDEIDFVICSHTLEDVRDPLWVCQEMVRIAKAGYIEVPSRLEEQCYGIEGPWVGRAHHRWLIDVEGDAITFSHKSHVLDRRRDCHFPFGFHEQLEADELVHTLWWEGSFEFGERFFDDMADQDRYMSEFVAEAKQGRHVPSRTLGIVRLLLDRAHLLGWGRDGPSAA